MTSVQWCSWFLYGSFSRTSRHLWPTPSERRKWMPRHPCTRRTPPREMHIQTPPSLCCWLHTQERGDTACLQRPHMMRKLSDKKHGPTECGKSWMNLDAKTFWKSLHCVLSMECYCCSRAMRITKVVFYRRIPASWLPLFIFTHFTYTISLWTLCKWIRLDFLTQFIQGSKLSYVNRCEAIVSTYLSSLFKRQFLMHFPDLIIHSYFLSCSFWLFIYEWWTNSPKSLRQLLSIGRFAVQGKCFVLEWATGQLLRIGRLMGLRWAFWHLDYPGRGGKMKHWQLELWLPDWIYGFSQLYWYADTWLSAFPRPSSRKSFRTHCVYLPMELPDSTELFVSGHKLNLHTRIILICCLRISCQTAWVRPKRGKPWRLRAIRGR